MSAAKPHTGLTRVQKLCTLWTHDDNFSRDDVVFNGDKFPEFPTAPGTLLQVVAIDSGTSVQESRATESGIRTDMQQTAGRGPTTVFDANEPRKKGRSGSITITIDENGSTLPGVRDVDVGKAYVFAAATLPLDLKSKYPNLQVSISERIAKVFGFRNRMQIILTEVWLNYAIPGYS
jgi:hypothetical protein